MLKHLNLSAIVGITILGVSKNPGLVLVLFLISSSHVTMSANGPLRVCTSNPRYFADQSGQPIYLTGLHTWNNFQDRSYADPPSPFHFDAYLDFLKQHNHNFIRLWLWEQSAWHPKTTRKMTVSPMPYPRTGPGAALDGKPKFNLNQFNQAYFDRLRERVIAAIKRKIYVSVMLFSIEKKKGAGNPGSPWNGHPFNKNNNINGINGDASGNGGGEEVHTLRIPAVTRLQEAYVRKVVDAINDLDNVLYEITNESPIQTKDWQYHMIKYVKGYEETKPQQHPVGIIYFYGGRWGAMDALLASPADWISPGNDGATYDYSGNPPAADGRKVIITDTDHLDGDADRAEVWKNFTRGNNFISMSTVPFHEDPIWGVSPSNPGWEVGQKSMGHTLIYAKRMNLVSMKPSNDLCSTGYCLANPGFEYLVYLPLEDRWYLRWWRRLRPGTLTLDLTTASRPFCVEWFNPATGESIPGGTIIGGISHSLAAPFVGDAVLYLTAVQSP